MRTIRRWDDGDLLSVSRLSGSSSPPDHAEQADRAEDDHTQDQHCPGRLHELRAGDWLAAFGPCPRKSHRADQERGQSQPSPGIHGRTWRLTGRPSSYESQNQQQDDGAHEGDEYRRSQPAERRSDVKAAENQASQEGAHDSDHDVADHAKAATDHCRSQPSGDQANHNPDKKSFTSQRVLLGIDFGNSSRKARFYQRA